MQDGLFSSSSAPQPLCKPWLLKSRITTHALLIPRNLMMALGVLLTNSFCTYGNLTATLGLLLPGLLTRQNHVQVHGRPSPETENTQSVSILEGMYLIFFLSNSDDFWKNWTVFDSVNQNRSHCVWVFHRGSSPLVIPNRRWNTRSFITHARFTM